MASFEEGGRREEIGLNMPLAYRFIYEKTASAFLTIFSPRCWTAESLPMGMQSDSVQGSKTMHKSSSSILAKPLHMIKLVGPWWVPGGMQQDMADELQGGIGMLNGRGKPLTLRCSAVLGCMTLRRSPSSAFKITCRAFPTISMILHRSQARRSKQLGYRWQRRRGMRLALLKSSPLACHARRRTFWDRTSWLGQCNLGRECASFSAHQVKVLIGVRMMFRYICASQK